MYTRKHVKRFEVHVLGWKDIRAAAQPPRDLYAATIQRAGTCSAHMAAWTLHHSPPQSALSKMEENRYKLLLEDPETFESALRLRYVEILNYEVYLCQALNSTLLTDKIQDSSLNTYKKGELDEKDVEAWLNKCVSDSLLL